MKEIKVGEYIRTTDGIIGTKVEYDNGTKIKIDEDTYYKLSEDSIVKHSPDITELLEVKDIIKYQELRSVTNIYGTKFYENYICDIHSEEELEQIKKEIKEYKIRLISVLTKESFKDLEYEV